MCAREKDSSKSRKFSSRLTGNLLKFIALPAAVRFLETKVKTLVIKLIGIEFTIHGLILHELMTLFGWQHTSKLINCCLYNRTGNFDVPKFIMILSQ